MTEPRTASEPSGQELVIVGMAGRRNGPLLSMRYDDDDDDVSFFASSGLRVYDGSLILAERRAYGYIIGLLAMT